MEIDWKRAWYFISQILTILGFAFLGLFIGTLLTYAIGIGVFKYDAEKIADLLGNPELISKQAMFLRLFQTLTHFGTIALPVFMYMRVYKYPVFSTLKLKKSFSFLQLILVFVFAFAALFALSFLSDINKAIPLPQTWREWADRTAKAQETLMNCMLYMPTQIHFFANIFVVGLVAAFDEEILFRGLLQPLFKNWTKNIHLGIFISAALFSAIHFDLDGFIPRLAIGIIFGYLFYWTGNLWVTILAHFLNNSFEVAVYYFKDTNSWCNYLYQIKYTPVAWGLISIAVIAGILFVFKRMSKLKVSEIPREV